tara:strand:- start:644 stop:1228 length:585 start_codon:yes stop_codon:yes gene_type:complete
MTTTKKKTTTKPKAKAPAPIPELPHNPFVFEVLELASKQRSAAKKVEVLQKYEDDSIKAILIFNFDDSIISMLPPGEVPYGDIGDQSVYSGTLSENIAKEMSGGESATGQDLDGRSKTSLRREWKSLYNYVKGGNDSLTSVRREMMFINLLRGLHPKEAELMCLVKDKALTTKYKITIDNVKKAYPDIQWGGRS